MSLDINSTVLFHFSDIACPEPAVFGQHLFRQFRLVVIAEHHVLATHPDLFVHNLCLHAGNDTSARTRFEVLPQVTRNKRTGFCQAVPYCQRELNVHQQLLHILIQCRTTNVELTDIAAQTHIQRLADHFLH